MGLVPGRASQRRALLRVKAIRVAIAGRVIPAPGDGVRRCGLAIVACLAAALAPPDVVAAGDTFSLPHPPLPQYVERAWNREDGLPHDIVWAALQTRDGYLWLGTHSGLARFDGVAFTTFTPDEAPELAGQAVLSLLEDRAGTLWIGTYGAGAFRYRSGRFEPVRGGRHRLGHVVRAMVEDRDGTVWIGSETGLHRFDDQGGGSTHLDTAVLGGDAISALAVDPNGALWIGTWEGGLLRLQGGELHRITTADGLTSNSIRALAVAPDGALWSASWGGGLDRVTGDGRVRNVRMPSPEGDRMRAVYVDATGTVWGGTQDGVGRIPAGGTEAVGFDHLVGRRITSIVEDREGNLWFCTYNDGLVKLSRDVVEVLDTRHGLRSDNVRAVLEDDSGLWIATNGGGLHRLRDGSVEVFTTADGLLSDRVYALHRDSTGVLWAGTLHGLNRFDGGRFIGLSDDRLRNALVLAIHRDTEGTVWVGTEGAGLHLYRDGAFRPADDARLASTTIRSFQTTPDGSLWIGTEDRGLFRYRNGAFTTFPAGAGPGSSVRGLYVDAEGALWIGTFSDGFSRWKDGKLSRFGVGNGLADNQVHQFLEDMAGRIWMSSDSGLFYTQVRQVEAAAGAAGATDSRGPIGPPGTIASAWFGRRREYNGASQPAAWRSRDGRLLFASMAGLVIVDPNRLAADRAAPPVRIERILADDRSLPATEGEVRLGPTDRASFEIGYTGLSFVSSQRIRFRYKLAGLDKDWIDAGTRRTAYYSYVPPGRYTFTVLAANSNGVWNREGASLELVVLPPFYRTWWFPTAVVAGALGLVAVTWRRRELRLRRAHTAQRAFSRQLIAAQEAERKRIAAELHDGLGQRLVIIKNLAILAAGTDAQPTGGRVEEISAEASQAIGEVREIAQNLRPHHLDHLGLTRALKALVRKAADASTIRFAATVDDLDGLFPKEAEITVYRVVQECVNNVLKHSNAATAEVTARHAGSRLSITVRDDGRGFEPATVDHRPGQGGFGLLGMIERVTSLGGRIDLRSAPGRGTNVAIAFDLVNLRQIPPPGNP